MQSIKQYKLTFIILFIASAIFGSCKKDGNPNNLPEVSPESYAGKIDGFDSSAQIFPQNLVAYWSFDNTKAELKSGKTPTETANDSFIDAGVKGKAISLNAGYLYYGSQFDAFKTESLKSFTISMWIQILNNGSKKTQIFQIARPGKLNGNIDFILDTELSPATNTDHLRIRGYFSTVGDGRQDNVNAFGSQNLSPTIGANKWTHLVLTYNISTAVFNIWADGIKVGNFPNRSTAANNLFKSWEPSEVIIGGNYNTIPGKAVNTNVTFAPMTGSIDEIRVYNTALPDAHIKALYNLGRAGK
ncbi:MAG: LamG-like jellyroll fold domain-containing protein [Chitinophagaceae bacterium]